MHNANVYDYPRNAKKNGIKDSDQVDYDVPPSSCGYPCYFSLYFPSSSEFDSACSTKWKDFITEEGDLILDSCALQKKLPSLSTCNVKSISGETYDVPAPHPRLETNVSSSNQDLPHQFYEQQTSDSSGRCFTKSNDPPTQHSHPQEYAYSLPRSDSQELYRSSHQKPKSFGSCSSLPAIHSARSSLGPSLSCYSFGDSNSASLALSGSELYDIPPLLGNGSSNSRYKDLKCSCKSDNSNIMDLSGLLQKPLSLSRSRPDSEMYISNNNGKITPCCNQIKEQVMHKYNSSIDSFIPVSPSASLFSSSSLFFSEKSFPPSSHHQNSSPGSRCSQETRSEFPQQTYDVPKPANYQFKRPDKFHNNENRLTTPPKNTSASREIVSSISTGGGSDPYSLDLTLDGAIDLALKLESDSQLAISQLLAISSEKNWRTREKITGKVDHLRFICNQLKNSIKDLVEFTNGVYINFQRCAENSINTRLNLLAAQIRNAGLIVCDAVHGLDAKGWSVERLARSEYRQPSSPEVKYPDELDRLLACLPGLKEDVKHIITFVKTHGGLIFPSSNLSGISNELSEKLSKLTPNKLQLDNESNKSQAVKFQLANKPLPPAPPPKPSIQFRPLPSLPIAKSDDKKSCQSSEFLSLSKLDKIDDDYPTNYDYISQNSPQKSNEDCRSENSRHETPKNQDNSNLVDKQLFLFYWKHLEDNHRHLKNTINSLIAAINCKQSAKVLIGLSKLVVISGQEMIFLGDKINRISYGDLSSYAARYSNSLCDALKNLITATKKAAQLYPSVFCLQELRDCAVQVSIYADQLNLIKEQ